MISTKIPLAASSSIIFPWEMLLAEKSNSGQKKSYFSTITWQPLMAKFPLYSEAPLLTPRPAWKAPYGLRAPPTSPRPLLAKLPLDLRLKELENIIRWPNWNVVGQSFLHHDLPLHHQRTVLLRSKQILWNRQGREMLVGLPTIALVVTLPIATHSTLWMTFNKVDL